MSYNKDFVLKTINDFKEIDEYLRNRAIEIGSALGVINDAWKLEGYSLDKETSELQLYCDLGGYSLKYVAIPTDWFFNDNWKNIEQEE